MDYLKEKEMHQTVLFLVYFPLERIPFSKLIGQAEVTWPETQLLQQSTRKPSVGKEFWEMLVNQHLGQTEEIQLVEGTEVNQPGIDAL